MAVFPPSELVYGAVPAPRGRLVAFRTTPCTDDFFDQHLVVKDLRTGKRWSLGADARPCHGLSDPSWNASATRLVFAYAPSSLRRGQHLTGGERGQWCPGIRAAGIVVASAEHTSMTTGWRFTAPRRGCTYDSASFDHRGVAAFEACSPHRRGPNYFEGSAFLVQLSTRGNVLSRTPLEPRASQGYVLSDPLTNVILVSEDQTYGQDRPTHDWVWRLKRGHLDLIATYAFSGQTEVAAQPW